MLIIAICVLMLLVSGYWEPSGWVKWFKYKQENQC